VVVVVVVVVATYNVVVVVVWREASSLKKMCRYVTVCRAFSFQEYNRPLEWYILVCQQRLYHQPPMKPR